MARILLFFFLMLTTGNRVSARDTLLWRNIRNLGLYCTNIQKDSAKAYAMTLLETARKRSGALP